MIATGTAAQHYHSQTLLKTQHPKNPTTPKALPGITQAKTFQQHTGALRMTDSNREPTYQVYNSRGNLRTLGNGESSDALTQAIPPQGARFPLPSGTPSPAPTHATSSLQSLEHTSQVAGEIAAVSGGAATILGQAELVVGAVPVVGEVVGGLALAAEAVSLVSGGVATLVDEQLAAQGHGSWGTVALDVAGVGLGIGGVGFKAESLATKGISSIESRATSQVFDKLATSGSAGAFMNAQLSK